MVYSSVHANLCMHHSHIHSICRLRNWCKSETHVYSGSPSSISSPLPASALPLDWSALHAPSHAKAHQHFKFLLQVRGHIQMPQYATAMFCRHAGCRFVVSKAFGLAGIRALDRITECCCERSNPALQIGYLVIWSVGYGLYWQHVFQLLPNLYAAEFHL